MGVAVVTLRIMPSTPETNLESILTIITKETRSFTGNESVETKYSVEPVAFGLKALKFIFVMNESLGSPDVLAQKLNTIEGVESVEVVDVRRAIG